MFFWRRKGTKIASFIILAAQKNIVLREAFRQNNNAKFAAQNDNLTLTLSLLSFCDCFVSYYILYPNKYNLTLFTDLGFAAL